MLFEDDLGRSRRITGDQLGTILQDEVSLRLAVLNACEGARSSVEDPFSGVATSLIEREIPAVIGMQFEITDRSAIVFASEFYAALADGYPVDSAMAEARKAIFADENDVEWATPVLFMRVQDGLLFDVPAHASAREQKPDPTVAVAAAKAEADAVKAGADPETAAAAATAAALEAAPAEAPSGPAGVERGEPVSAGQAAVGLEAEADNRRWRQRRPPRRSASGCALNSRRRGSVSARPSRSVIDSLPRRRRPAWLRRSGADRTPSMPPSTSWPVRPRLTRHEEEARQRTEAAAASAAEAARLETQRVLISDEVDRLKAERRRLEAELRAERDATAGQVDPKMAGTAGAGATRATQGATAGSPSSGSSGQEGSWSASAMGSSKTAGGATAPRAVRYSGATAREKSTRLAPANGWRSAETRTAGRPSDAEFLAGALTRRRVRRAVPRPEQGAAARGNPIKWGQWIRRLRRAIFALAVVTILSQRSAVCSSSC